MNQSDLTFMKFTIPLVTVHFVEISKCDKSYRYW